VKRRQFLTSTLAASALALSDRPNLAQTQPAAASQPRQYYELRKYQLEAGHQSQVTSNYVSSALIPALNRLGISPVGAFNLDLGPETPTLYVLLPANSLQGLIDAKLRLRTDEQFLAAADAFWNAPESSPAFLRVESTLLIALEGWPQLVVPPQTAEKGKRVFQLRSYESASDRDHLRKIQMIHEGEFDIFRRAGFSQVFFGDALIGSRLPQLTYMVSFTDLKQLDDLWNAFRGDPQWKKLAASPEFSFEPIVSNVTNLVLNPAPYSQI
jgi:hypothetical protein